MYILILIMEKTLGSGVSGEELFSKYTGMSYNDIIVLDTIFSDIDAEEIDFGVGQIIETLKQEGLEENTLVVFTSDNGPWLVYKEHGGSAGLLREGKGMTWEGGMREPTIFYWKGKIKPKSETSCFIKISL